MMDGVILSVPPRTATARQNHLRGRDTHMWRRKSEAVQPSLVGQDKFITQVPLSRAVPI